jgi:FkbM family methyltransferase
VSENLHERRRRQFAVEPIEAPPHPVLAAFGPWEGWAEPGWDVNFLGVRTRTAFFSLYDELADFSERRWVRGGRPVPNEDYFEWITLLESVTEAKGSYTIVELGAGWGKWITAGVVALRSHSGLPYHVVGVESEPTHFRWMQQHLIDNDVDLANATLIEAAVAAEDGATWFHVGSAADWYGQGIADPPNGGAVRGDRLGRLRRLVRRRPSATAEKSVARVRALSLNTILAPLETVDLVDVDIQGAEADVLYPAAETFNRKVKRVYVATHSASNEERVRELFRSLRWESVYDFPGGGESDTPWGRIMFEDGVHVWRNPSI